MLKVNVSNCKQENCESALNQWSNGKYSQRPYLHVDCYAVIMTTAVYDIAIFIQVFLYLAYILRIMLV